MKKYFTCFFITLVIGAGFISCDKNRVFNKFRPIKNAEWNKDSMVVFNVPVADTVQKHRVLLSVRNEISYKYRNLWLFIEITQPNGNALKDSFDMVLADPSGEWLGKGIGGIKTRQALFRQNFCFPDSGHYIFSIQHGMREDVLKGIRDIGIRIEKVKEGE